MFEEVGYDAAPTNLVASRAEVPVGTLYRWFPDKAALAEALADRYLDEMLTLYNDLLSSLEPGERIGDYLRRVLQRSASQAAQHRPLSPLLLSSLVPVGRPPAGDRPLPRLFVARLRGRVAIGRDREVQRDAPPGVRDSWLVSCAAKNGTRIFTD